MDYLTSITPDHQDLIQALKDTAAGKPCVVVLTPLTTSPCGMTTLLEIVKEVFTCYLVNPSPRSYLRNNDPLRWDLQSQWIEDRKYQCLILPPLERGQKGRVNDIDHTIEDTVTNLVKYQVTKPVWVDSVQAPLPPQDFGASLQPYKVYTIRLKPIVERNRNFVQETFTQRFYWRLNREIFGGEELTTKWQRGLWPSGSEAESRTLLKIPKATDSDEDGDDKLKRGDYSAISTVPHNWDDSYNQLYRANHLGGHQGDRTTRPPNVTMAISGAAIQKISSEGRTGAYLRAMLIHDQVTKLAQLCNAPVPVDEFSDLLQLESFKFTVEYTTIDPRDHEEVTTTIKHDFKFQLADSDVVTPAKISITLT